MGIWLACGAASASETVDLLFCDGTYTQYDLQAQRRTASLRLQLESVGPGYHDTAARDVCVLDSVVSDVRRGLYYVIINQGLPQTDPQLSRYTLGAIDPTRPGLIASHPLGQMETWSELNLSVDVARELLVVTGERHLVLSMREVDFFKPSNAAPDPDRIVFGKSGLRSLANRLLFDHRESRDLEKDLGSSLSKLLRLGFPIRFVTSVGLVNRPTGYS